MINNASVWQASPFLEISLEQWQTAVDVNLTGPFLCSQAVAPYMLEQKSGLIINITDLSAFQTWVNYAHHAASKAALVALTRVMAAELAPDVRVNAIAPGTVLLPGPALGSHAWVRRRAGQRTYALCGITHTVSTRRIMDGLFHMLSAPVEDWDAIICTSQAVRDVVAREIDEGVRYLTRRFGARRVPRPMLPVIPLGIDTARFGPDGGARARWRAEFGIDDDTVVLMSMGRLTVAEKMHPVPLFMAAQQAATGSGRRIALLMVGWFADEDQEHQHREMAAEFAPDVDVHFPDGRDGDLRYSIWAAADIFTLPVDNVQETFGLAPVEAMAAGLPVICSDWNGFKDTIEDGVTGFRVRTLMSPPGSGREIAERFEDNTDRYLQYLGFVHQRTAVDVREMAEVIMALAASPERRAEMGAAGVERARRHYDWSVIIPQYQALWAEQTARRARGLPTSPHEPGEAVNPAAMDPFTLYQGYATDRLTTAAVISAEVPCDRERIEELLDLTGAMRLRRLVTGSENLAKIHAAVVAGGPLRLDALVAETKLHPDLVAAAVLWLAKFDLGRIEV